MSDQNDGGRDTDEEPTVAVTGAAGYIGSRVLVELQEEHPEWSLIALDNYYRGQVDSIGDVAIQHVDIRNRSRLEAALEGADVVLHLAAISGVDDCDENPDLAYEVNVTGTNNVAWFCRKTGAALTFPFSMAVLGDPESFPITADLPRDPMNWYGRTKYLGEQTVRALAEGAFPAHLLLKSNLYGEHEVDGTVVSKPTVINFFVERALSGEPLTVYEPGTQARNYVHVKDVAQVYLRIVESLWHRSGGDERTVDTYEVASDDDPDIMTVAGMVQRLAREELGREIEVRLVDNPRGNETLVENFEVDTSAVRERLGWHPQHTIEGSIRNAFERHAGR